MELLCFLPHLSAPFLVTLWILSPTRFWYKLLQNKYVCPISHSSPFNSPVISFYPSFRLGGDSHRIKLDREKNRTRKVCLPPFPFFRILRKSIKRVTVWYLEEWKQWVIYLPFIFRSTSDFLTRNNQYSVSKLLRSIIILSTRKSSGKMEKTGRFRKRTPDFCIGLVRGI